MNSIIVTGGAGFIGSHITDRLIGLGHRVVVLDNLSTGKKANINPRAEFVKMDIRDQKITPLFLRVKPSYVFHLAAQLDVRKSLQDPLFDAEVNILGSLNVINAAHAVHVRKLIFTSSGGAVYGDTDILPTPETVTENPISPYGVAKLAIDKYLHQYWVVNKLHYTSIRFSNVYGPRQNPHGEAGVVAIFAGKLSRSESCIINGTGAQTRDFVYVGDVADAAVKAMQMPFVGPVNIATGKETSVIEIYRTLAKAASVGAGRDLPLRPIHRPAIKGEQMRSVLSWKKAKKVLKWIPEISLQEGLRRTVEWHQLHTSSHRG